MWFGRVNGGGFKDECVCVVLKGKCVWFLGGVCVF